MLLSGCVDVGPQPRPRSFAVDDPYRADGTWLKANFHVHTSHSHGRMRAGDLVELYRQNGYGALCITDHNQYGDQDGGVLSGYYQRDSTLHDWNGDGITHPDSILGSGVEALVRDWGLEPADWKRDRWFRPATASIQDVPLVLSGYEASYAYFGAHFGLIGYPPGPIAAPRPGFEWLEPLHRNGGFAYIAHPGDANADIERFATLLPSAGFDAMEIINGARLTRGEAADATPLWDALLSRGRVLWGMANDDAHKLPGEDELYPFIAYDMVLCTQPTVEAVLAALHAGAFYASTGLQFDELRLNGATLYVRVPDARRIRFIGRDGRVLWVHDGTEAIYPIRGDEGYVRVEASGALYVGPRNSWARGVWSQPFRISAVAGASGP